jgi:hypothetical protein
MLYNKRFIKIILITLLLLLITNTIFAYYNFQQLETESVTIDSAQSNYLLASGVFILIGIILVAVFFYNTINNDRFIHGKAEKESETYLLNETALMHKLSEVIELSSNYAITHSILILSISFKGTNKTLYEI